MLAWTDQGEASVILFKAPLLHFAAHSPQKVHSPREKLTAGNPPRPGWIIFSGQAPTQSPQRVQASTKRVSSIAQGGRVTERTVPKFPCRNWARLESIKFSFPTPSSWE